MAQAVRNGDRHGRAPGRAGGHRHRQVAGLPGAGDPARRRARHHGRRLHGDDRAAAPARRPGPAPAREGAHSRCSAAHRRSRSSRAAATTCASTSCTAATPDEPGRRAVRPVRAISAHRAARSSGSTSGQTTTATGDRDELVPGVPDQAWRQVSVTARECLGAAKCPFGEECFAEQARDEAGAGRRRRHQPRAARHRRARGPPGAARARRGDRRRGARAGRPGHRRGDRRADRRRGRDRGRARLRQAGRPGRRGSRSPRRARAWRWSSTTCRPGRLGRRSPRPAAGALSAVRDAAVACRRSLGGERREEPEAGGGAQGRAGRAGRGRGHRRPAAQRLRRAGRRPSGGTSCGSPNRARTARGRVLRAAPLCGRRAAARAAVRASTVVLTSATLTLGGTFDALARQWGLPPARPGAAAARRRPSDWRHRDRGGRRRGAGPDAPLVRARRRLPVPHAKSGILYVAKHLPPPGRDGLPPAYLDEIAGLVEAAGGRTLGLFSSMRAAKQATDALRDRLTPRCCARATTRRCCWSSGSPRTRRRRCSARCRSGRAWTCPGRRCRA